MRPGRRCSPRPTRGLFLVEPGGAVVEVSPGPGAAARAGNRLAVGAGWIAVASDDGVFLSRDARRWLRPATGISRRSRDGGRAARAGGCARVLGGRRRRAVERASRRRRRGARRARVPAADGFLRRRQRRARRRGAGSAGGRRRAGVSHGARAARCAGRLARACRSSSRPAPRCCGWPRGPGSSSWPRCAACSSPSRWRGPGGAPGPRPASAAVRALAGDPAVLFAAADTGLLAGAALVPGAAGEVSERQPVRLPEEPAIERGAPGGARVPAAGSEVDGRHAAGRRASRLASGRRRCTARSRTTRARRRRGTRRSPEAPCGAWSTATATTRRTYDVGLTFSWDLGDIAYHPEAIDVSREAREVIELRDDVLDEITQLYFERRRVLAQLQAPSDPGEAERLCACARTSSPPASTRGPAAGSAARPSASPPNPCSSPRAGGN